MYSARRRTIGWLRPYRWRGASLSKSDFERHWRSADLARMTGWAAMENILNTIFKTAIRPNLPVAIRSSADWKPEPCGLTREEVRAIIVAQLG